VPPLQVGSKSTNGGFLDFRSVGPIKTQPPGTSVPLSIPAHFLTFSFSIVSSFLTRRAIRLRIVDHGLASRRIVGWSMSDRIKADLVCDALKSAYWGRKPSKGLIMHSDRGSQYASDRHRPLLQDYGMIPSMSRRANCWDNSATESFFKTLKVERIYQLRYETRAIAKLDIVNWIEGFYNHRRFHSSIGYQTPVAVESSLRTA
jgi:transposase InsO family protein